MGSFRKAKGGFSVYQNLLYQNLLAFVALGRVEARRTFYIVVSSHRILSVLSRLTGLGQGLLKTERERYTLIMV